MPLPWPIALALRFVIAVGSALTLLANPRLLLGLPWGYIRRRIRNDGRTAYAATCLGLSTGSVVVGIAVPDGVGVALLVATVNLVLVVRDRG